MNVPYASRSGPLDARGQPIQSGLSSPVALDFKKDGIVVFSGGTAANFLVDVFNRIVERRGCPLTYVIPISDNGGSSSELIRVLGGPSKFCLFIYFAFILYLPPPYCPNPYIHPIYVPALLCEPNANNRQLPGVGDIRSESFTPPFQTMGVLMRRNEIITLL